MWTIGGSPNKGRQAFSDRIWEEVKKRGMKLDNLATDANLYAYAYVMTGEAAGSWLPWMETVPVYEPPRGATYESIVVPTLDSVRLTHIFSTLLLKRKHVLIPGNTGTGKSSYLTLWLTKFAPETVMSAFVNFS